MEDKTSWIDLKQPFTATLTGQTCDVMRLSNQGFSIQVGSPLSPKPQSDWLLEWEKDGEKWSFSGTLVREKNSPENTYLLFTRNKERLHELLAKVRKNQHIDICTQVDVESTDKFTGFSRFQLTPKSIPELDFTDIDPSCLFLGQHFKLPLLITGMTGGVDKGSLINARLAAIAQKHQIPMGIGSQRIAIENKNYEDIFQLKKTFPSLYLIGNLGFSQVLGSGGLETCLKAVEMISADALAIHVNLLQESIQAEGDRAFSGFFASCAKICAALPVPLIIKEVGAGMDIHSAQRLQEIGVAAIDCGGRGGTSWGYIEGLRSQNTLSRSLASQFRDWGIPTAFSLGKLQQEGITLPLIATGGVRDGVTIAKACALGAQMVGIGLPFFKAALQSEERLEEFVADLEQALKIAMLATGSRTISELHGKVSWGHPYERDCEKIWSP